MDTAPMQTQREHHPIDFSDTISFLVDPYAPSTTAAHWFRDIDFAAMPDNRIKTRWGVGLVG
jgi:hypothetical protein